MGSSRFSPPPGIWIALVENEKKRRTGEESLLGTFRKPYLTKNVVGIEKFRRLSLCGFSVDFKCPAQ